MESWSRAVLNTCSCLDLTALTHLTLPTHTNTVWVLVWTACAIQDHPLHEDHISCFLRLAMQVAALGSWETITKAYSERLNYCQNVTPTIHLDDLMFTTNMWLFFFCVCVLNELHMSQRDTVSHCVCMSESYYNYVSPQRQNLAVHPSENAHSHFITFITHGHNPGTLSNGALTRINCWIPLCGGSTFLSRLNEKAHK